MRDDSQWVTGDYEVPSSWPKTHQRTDPPPEPADNPEESE